ncbi:hypothetical protein [Lactococcus lactis]|uniref:hypothetical protein n=1 Tax=Lactococcus lactis TaxID=1358 RepID=UPI00223AE94E|nr:hypothetical protein [Lactococcus lactis]
MQIIFRPVMQKIKVEQRQWVRVGNQTSKTNKTATAYVYKFSHWDYSQRNV